MRAEISEEININNLRSCLVQGVRFLLVPNWK
jgi:hypothetical protein